MPLKKMTNNFTFFCFERKLYATTSTKIMFNDVKHFLEWKFFEIRLIFLIDLIFEIRTTFFSSFEAILIFSSFFSSFSMFEKNEVRYFKMLIDEFAELIFSNLILIFKCKKWRTNGVWTFLFFAIIFLSFKRHTSKWSQ